MRKVVTNILAVLALALSLSLAGCVITTEGTDEKAVLLADIFPPSKAVSSYRQLDKPKRVGLEEMTAQVGGQARLQQMQKWSAFSSQFVDYGLPGQRPKVRVTISEMATKLDAYGAYSNLRPAMLDDDRYLKIGVHATLDEDRLILVHDRYLAVVRDLAETPGEQRRALLINFGRSISSRIPRPITDVEPVAFLPLQNRVAASERLDKEDPLGLGVLQQGAVSAVYRFDKREARLFVAYIGAGFSKRAELTRLKKIMEQNGEVSDLKVGDAGYAGHLQGHPAMIAQREDVVFGALGTFTADEMRELMASVDRRVHPIAPLKYADKKKEEAEKEEKKSGYQFTP